MRLSVPVLLSFNGGYVDTAGFLAIEGLFSAHVTGNFVTIGAALVNGTSGVLTKLLALPVFCIVVLLTRLASFHLSRRSWTSLEALLALKMSLLLAAAVMVIFWGPFRDGDSARALIAGMTLVSAMAIQNTVHRSHLGASPPSTVMTGTTTQAMMDLADLIRGLDPQARAATLARVRGLTKTIASFAVGAASSALLFHWVAAWSFVPPPLIAALALVAARQSEAQAR